MKILVAFAVILLVSAQIFAAEVGFNDDIDWPYSDQMQDELQGPMFENFLQRIARKPRPDQFYGLMGKRNGFGQISRKRFGQISRRRYKPDSFYGLMGKRSLYSGFNGARKKKMNTYSRTLIRPAESITDEGCNDQVIFHTIRLELLSNIQGLQNGTHYIIMKEDANESSPVQFVNLH